MQTFSILSTAVLASAAAIAVPATASTLAFTGSSLIVNPPALPAPACPAPLLDLGFGPSGTSGTSNLGTFHFHAGALRGRRTRCLRRRPIRILFTDGDTLGGAYTGVLTPTGTMGLLGNRIDYRVTSGTGIFQNATGFITGDGTVDFRSGVARVLLSLNGLIDGVVP